MLNKGARLDADQGSRSGFIRTFGAGGGDRALMRMAAVGQHDADLEPVDAVGSGRPSRR